MEFNQAFDPIRALQSAWKVLAQAPLPILVGGVLLALTEGGGGFGGNFSSSVRDHGGNLQWSDVEPWILPLIGVVACVGIACFLFSSWIMAGFPHAVESVLRTGRADVGQVFDAKGRYGAMLLVRILRGFIIVACVIPLGVFVAAVAILTKGFQHHHEIAILVIVLGALVWLPFYFYVLLGTTLAKQAVALEGLPPIDSLKRSWSLVHGHRLMMFLYCFVAFVFSVLGLCLCCVGVFLTGTLVHVAKSESYLALVRGQERANWWIEKGSAHPVAPPEGWGAPPPPPAAV